MHSNSTIYHNEWADRAHYFHIASVNKIDKAHLCAMKEQTATGSSIKIKSEQNRKSHSKWMQQQNKTENEISNQLRREFIFSLKKKNSSKNSVHVSGHFT